MHRDFILCGRHRNALEKRRGWFAEGPKKSAPRAVGWEATSKHQILDLGVFAAQGGRGILQKGGGSEVSPPHLFEAIPGGPGPQFSNQSINFAVCRVSLERIPIANRFFKINPPDVADLVHCIGGRRVFG